MFKPWFMRGHKVNARDAIKSAPLATLVVCKDSDQDICDDTLAMIALGFSVKCSPARKALGEALYHFHQNNSAAERIKPMVLSALTDPDQIAFYLKSIEPRSKGGCFIG